MIIERIFGMVDVAPSDHFPMPPGNPPEAFNRILTEYMLRITSFRLGLALIESVLALTACEIVNTCLRFFTLPARKDNKCLGIIRAYKKANAQHNGPLPSDNRL